MQRYILLYNFLILIFNHEFYSQNLATLNTKKIVITGGPGTGKSSIIEELKKRKHICFEEISRQITLDARKNGIEQLFLTEPLLFSELLLEGRLQQFSEADSFDDKYVFLDRGIHDVLAYMDYFNSKYPPHFEDMCESSTYDAVFILAPWQDIFESDNVRYESFEQAELIHQYLINIYKRFNYKLINVPFDSVAQRTDFILEHLHIE